MTRNILIAAVCLVTLSACGGGGGGGDSGGTASTAPPAATAEVPASASASIEGFVSYLMALIGSDADTLEPVSVAQVTPPTSEEAPPVAVD